MCVAFEEQKFGPEMDDSSRKEPFLKAPALPAQVLFIDLVRERLEIVGLPLCPNCQSIVL